VLYGSVNVGGTVVLLEAAREFDVTQFVFGSSSSVYGARAEAPFAESDRVDEPVSPYAATKKAGELLCHAHHHLYGIPVTCLRFFTVYGPRGRPDMAPYKFTRRIARGDPVEIYGDGSALRDFTYVDDIVQGVLRALDRPFPYEIINLGNHRPVTVKHFVGIVERAVGRQADVRYGPEQPGDVPMTCADITKARALLGFEPRTTLEEGMARFLEWYRATGRDREDPSP
jgi:UDP-glucuronate 4-epimerase